MSDKNNSSQVSRQKNVFFQENSQNDDFYDEYNESSHLEDSFKESIKATTTTTDEDVSKQRSSQRKSSSHLSRASNNNNSEVAEIRSVSPKINPITKPEVPCFWLRVFLNCKYTKDRVQVNSWNLEWFFAYYSKTVIYAQLCRIFKKNFVSFFWKFAQRLFTI